MAHRTLLSSLPPPGASSSITCCIRVSNRLIYGGGSTHDAAPCTTGGPHNTLAHMISATMAVGEGAATAHRSPLAALFLLLNAFTEHKPAHALPKQVAALNPTATP